jgi:hypothetical protein
MLAALVQAFKRWRVKSREYQIQRALFRESTDASSPSGRAARLPPPTATQTPDPWQSSEDE